MAETVTENRHADRVMMSGPGTASEDVRTDISAAAVDGLAIKSEAPGWMADLLAAVERMAPEQADGEAFEAVRARFKQAAVLNAHGCPAITIPCQDQDGKILAVEMVLLAHSLLCTFGFGYVRFGHETRLALDSFADFASFPHGALRGFVVSEPSDTVRAVVSPEFLQFVRASAGKEYPSRFRNFFLSATDVLPESQIIWPLSRERRLFETLAAATREYGLPVTDDSIVLDPARPEFLGFKKVEPQGVEFRAGEDFIRFTPLGVELRDGEKVFRHSGRSGLAGWAVDSEGRICAIIENAAGFQPPAESELVRFLTVEQAQSERESLNVLA